MKQMKQHKRIQSKVIKQEKVFQSKWLGVKYTTYSIGDRVVPNYQTVYRPTTRNKGIDIDGVQVIPVIKYSDPNKSSQIIIIANYRPPVNNFVLQFPSGLAQDENYQQNARRQVLEQTGFVIKSFIKIPYPIMNCDPWKSNQSGLLYLGIIDGDSPQSYKQQQLQNQQNIIVHKLQLNQKLIDSVSKLIEENKYTVESKVWSICIGLGLLNLLKM